MVESGNERKKNSSLYKVASTEFVNGELSDLVSRTAQELANVATTGPVSLTDTAEIKKRTILYMRACEEASSIPSITGLARSMGLTRQSLYDCIWRKSPKKTAEWLELCRDAFSDVLAEASLRNNCNGVVSIFLQKAAYGLRESVEIVAKQDVSPLGETIDPEELRKRIEANIVDDYLEDDE